MAVGGGASPNGQTCHSPVQSRQGNRERFCLVRGARCLMVALKKREKTPPRGLWSPTNPHGPGGARRRWAARPTAPWSNSCPAPILHSERTCWRCVRRTQRRALVPRAVAPGRPLLPARGRPVPRARADRVASPPRSPPPQPPATREEGAAESARARGGCWGAWGLEGWSPHSIRSSFFTESLNPAAGGPAVARTTRWVVEPQSCPPSLSVLSSPDGPRPARGAARTPHPYSRDDGAAPPASAPPRSPPVSSRSCPRGPPSARHAAAAHNPPHGAPGCSGPPAPPAGGGTDGPPW